LLNIEIKSAPQTQTTANKRTEFVPAKNQPQKIVEMTREEFLAQKITVLGLESSQLSSLQNNGVRTMADFLAQTEETFSMMKAKNGMAYTSLYMQLQDNMKKKLESL
jgi:hypothetical protein